MCDEGKEICQKVCCTSFQSYCFAYLTCCFFFSILSSLWFGKLVSSVTMQINSWYVTISPQKPYPGYQRFFLACDGELSAADTSSAEGRRRERRRMFWYKRGCNWLGAIKGMALRSRGFSRWSLFKTETGNRAWKVSGTQGTKTDDLLGNARRNRRPQVRGPIGRLIVHASWYLLFILFYVSFIS